MRSRHAVLRRTVPLIALASLNTASAFALQAQPVPVPEEPSLMPQIEIDGVGIATLNYGNPLEATPVGPKDRFRGGLDFSDSSLLFGAAQSLEALDGVGSLGFGILAPAEGVTAIGSPLFIHQAFLDIQTESTEWLIGRSDNRAAHLVDFPTLREESVLVFTAPLNPFSYGQNSEENRYSNSASFTLNQGLSTFESVHIQHLIDSRSAGSTATSLNSFGFSFQYLCPPGMEALSRIVSAAVGFEHQVLEQPQSQGLSQVQAGGVVNLRESLTDRWDFRAQEIVAFGSALSQFQALGDTYQAAYHALAAAVRYLHSPFGKPGFQLALTGGYRNFFNINQASSWALALTGVKRLGEGFDLVAQLRGEWRDTALAAQSQGQSSLTVAEVGLVFNFNGTFNRHLNPRRTPLNFQHQFIP